MYADKQLNALPYHRGRTPANEVWVFGIVDVSHSPDRPAATLLPIIQAHVAPGTEIHSDQRAAYNGISSLPLHCQSLSKLCGPINREPHTNTTGTE